MAKYIPSAMPCNVDLNILAEISEGLSGSDISNCVLKSALSSARQGDNQVTLTHFEQAIKEVKASQKANQKNSNTKTTITTKEVSEEYAKDQLNQQTQGV